MATSIQEQQRHLFPYEMREPHFRFPPALKRGKKIVSGHEATFFDFLENIHEGFLQVMTPDGALMEFGSPASSLRATVFINNPRFYSRVLKGASLAFGESYMDGWWDVQDDRIVDCLGIILKNRLHERIREDPLLSLRLWLQQIRNLPLSIADAMGCVEKHYDLSNEFYSMLLGPTMTYSCGLQLRAMDTIDEMQNQKHELISKKLGLDRGGRIADLGCGWGSFLTYAAQHFRNVRGTGVTLSKKQYEFARHHTSDLAYEDRIDIRLRDYRELRGFFDFVVSIGMLEHVGEECYPELIQQISHLLKPKGTGLIETLAVTDAPENRMFPWIETHVFPGGRIPRLQEVISHMQRYGLVVAHVEDLKLHYAETFRRWKQNFDANALKIRAIGPAFDERFMRKWNYYLQVSEAAFRYSTLQLYQILFSKEGNWVFPRNFGKW